MRVLQVVRAAGLLFLLSCDSGSSPTTPSANVPGEPTVTGGTGAVLSAGGLTRSFSLDPAAMQLLSGRAFGSMTLTQTRHFETSSKQGIVVMDLIPGLDGRVASLEVRVGGQPTLMTRFSRVGDRYVGISEVGSTGVLITVASDGAGAEVGGPGVQQDGALIGSMFAKQIDSTNCDAALLAFASANAWSIAAAAELAYALAFPPVAEYLYANVIAAELAVVAAAYWVASACPA